jgi:hypothetical protein
MLVIIIIDTTAIALVRPRRYTSKINSTSPIDASAPAESVALAVFQFGRTSTRLPHLMRR